MMIHQIIRSNRKSISICVNRNAQVIIRAPLRMPEEKIHTFVFQHTDWIEKQRRKMQQLPPQKTLTDQEISILRKNAKEYLPSRVLYFSKYMNLYPTGIKITSARTRFGSCNANNSLCFSLRLMLLPENLIDYVIVHELAHIREKNHSAHFYAIIEQYLPDYKQRIDTLKTLSWTLPV